jgi:hypothetical protein
MLEARRTENGRCIVVPGPKERVSRDLGTTSQSNRCASMFAVTTIAGALIEVDRPDDAIAQGDAQWSTRNEW